MSVINETELKLEINKILNEIKADAFYGSPAPTMATLNDAQNSLLDLYRENERVIEFENKILTEQWSNLMSRFVSHKGDSLDEFMRAHISSFIYDERISELSNTHKTLTNTKENS